jgi:glycosyltransferase involved in cell wall biosynthesis
MHVASVVITTKDRCDELVQAVSSALKQSVAVEVLVIDDGSTDGTSNVIRTQFPSVRLERSNVSMGLIVQRNYAARLASGSIIFSIDDDAYFPSSETVAQTLREFDDPRIGAVAIPYIEPRKSPNMHQRAPESDGMFVTNSFIGTAHALRKDVFLLLNGYREHLFHQGEEPDLCVRMLQAGYVVRLGRADPIHHMESPRRDLSRMDYFGRRNDVLFAWQNVPMPYFPVHLAGTTLNGLMTAYRLRRFKKMTAGLLRGYLDCFRFRRKRRPVSRAAYRLYRYLKKAGPRRLSEVEPVLPPLGQTSHHQLPLMKSARS